MDKFRVGLSPDFKTYNAAHIVDAGLKEILGPLPFIQYEFFEQEDKVVAPSEIKDYDALIILTSRFTPDSFKGVERVVVLARWGVGYDNIDVNACTDANVLLAITTDAVRRPMAESILTILLALSRNLMLKERLVRAGRWDQRGPASGVGLRGKTIGSVALGNIASEMFRLLKHLDVGRMLAYDPYVTKEYAAGLGVEMVDLPTLFKEADFLTINCPLNDGTRGLIGADLLKLMKPTAYFVNTARGGIVDETALIEILKERKIAGAGLDVFDQEPLPLDSPLLQLDNVLLTPHAIAWGNDVYGANTVDSCGNLLTVLRGEIPKYTVNKEVVQKPKFQAKLASLRKRWAALAG
jgi:phosphoglycerate dehydrogenase-like enzyme